ncbi:MAG TPA: DUF2946 family protein [Phenylobacterium sp.]|uniref:DUF2946 family protein n=1 Tax=Phenylobacterium sp. TaxID=1871053 RepID=UPI002B48A5F5|nr:DUF2946 family protein [Phenylobacterium sp.]HKR90011.1 DUF2946 family protein [Phenylobacterium sp.]
MTRSAPLRLAFLIALLCAVSLRLLTPPGWMPNLDGRSSAPLVICTGDGVHHVRSADPRSHDRASEDSHEVCAFAGLALERAPQVAVLAAPAAPPRTAAAPLPVDQVRTALRWRRPQAARAPPVTA